MKPERDDIVSDILQRCIDACPGFGVELAAELERAVRQEWGGDRPYVRKPEEAKIKAEARKAAVRRDIQAGISVSDLQELHGISRAGIYRLLKKK